MSESAVFHAEGVSKRYRVRVEKSLALGLVRRNRPREHWALRELDLDVQPGEVLAVIGRNGAGKSTLLKIAAGVTTPTTGSLRRPRRVAPLIEVGAGFHPDLTGRENVEINARLLGVGAHEIRSRFDQIVDFAELSESIDRPVRQYSSGMFMRLGFAVAIHTRPDLLIVDEVLAVGDLPFQVRCLDRIRDLREQGVGVLFVSHNLTAVLSLSDRALLLERGVVRAEGPASDVVGAYHQSLAETPGDGSVLDERGATGQLRLTAMTVTDEHGVEPPLWQPGQRAWMTLHVTATDDTPEALLGFRFIKDGAGMVGRWLAEDGPVIPALRAGESAEVVLELSVNFSEGGYSVDLAIGPRDMKGLFLIHNGLYRFGVGSRKGGQGIVDLSPVLTVRRGP